MECVAQAAFSTVESNTLGSTYEDGGLLTGSSGPQRSQTEVTNSGFYLRKYVDQTAMSSTRGIRSDMWWVRFRLGEIYLNASEAALELGKTADALKYVNTLRERAGFRANSIKTLTIERLQNERRVELAFEDHRVWDLKRWRIAHEVWNGNASNPDAVIYALYPYRVVGRDIRPTANMFSTSWWHRVSGHHAFSRWEITIRPLSRV